MVFFLQKLIIVERVLNKTLFILHKKDSHLVSL
nr:MAG TPA: hypothetical protein [Caudoviricetes sp.]